MERFEQVVAHGTVDEKRCFVRAFLKEIVLDPNTGAGSAQLFIFPKVSADETPHHGITQIPLIIGAS